MKINNKKLSYDLELVLWYRSTTLSYAGMFFAEMDVRSKKAMISGFSPEIFECNGEFLRFSKNERNVRFFIGSRKFSG